MGSDPKSIRTLKDITKTIPTANDLTDAFMSAIQESDRAFGVVAASLVEGALATLLLTKFPALTEDRRKEVFEGDGALSTFSRKIALGHAFALYGDQTRADLDCIRDLRNAFAHSRIPLTFSGGEVKNVCLRLKYLGEVHEKLGKKIISAKDIFFLNCYMLASAFDDLSIGDPVMRELKAASDLYSKIFR